MALLGNGQVPSFSVVDAGPSLFKNLTGEGKVTGLNYCPHLAQCRNLQDLNLSDCNGVNVSSYSFPHFQFSEEKVAFPGE